MFFLNVCDLFYICFIMVINNNVFCGFIICSDSTNYVLVVFLSYNDEKCIII